MCGATVLTTVVFVQAYELFNSIAMPIAEALNGMGVPAMFQFLEQDLVRWVPSRQHGLAFSPSLSLDICLSRSLSLSLSLSHALPLLLVCHPGVLLPSICCVFARACPSPSAPRYAGNVTARLTVYALHICNCCDLPG